MAEETSPLLQHQQDDRVGQRKGGGMYDPDVDSGAGEGHHRLHPFQQNDSGNLSIDESRRYSRPLDVNGINTSRDSSPCTSEPTDEEKPLLQPREPLSPSLFFNACPVSTQTSKCGVFCILLVAYLQACGFHDLGMIIGKTDRAFFDKKEQRAIEAVLGVIVYILPIVAGLISDTVISRHSAMLFALLLKFLGSILSFLAHIVVSHVRSAADPSSDQTIRILMWVNIIGFALLMIAVCFFPLFVSFGAQQVNQSTRDTVTSFLRGLLLAVCLGVLTSAGLEKLPKEKRAIPGLTSFVVDALSLVVFLVGIRKYNTATADTGRKRFKEFIQILRTFIPCFCGVRRFDETFDPWAWEGEDRLIELRNRRALDRLHLKKAILIVALLSCGAVASNMYYLIFASANLVNNQYQGHSRRVVGYVKDCGYVIVFVTIAGMEALARCHESVARVINDKTFKKMGVGSLFATFACLIAGMVATGIWVDGADQVSVYWLFPQFILCGVGGALIVVSVLEIGFFESGPGLATVVCALGASLSFTSVTVVGVVLSKIDYHTIRRYDYIFYIMSGVMAVTFLVIYIPVSMWYTGIKINIASISSASGESQSGQESESAETAGSSRNNELLGVVEENA